MFQSTLRPSSGYSVLALWETASGSMLRSHHLLGKVCAEWVEHIYYIVITVLVFNSLAWWRGVDGRGFPSGVIAPVVVAGLGVVHTSVLCAGLLVLCVFPLSSLFFSSSLWSWIGAGSCVAVLRVVLFGRDLYDVNSLFELYPVYGFTSWCRCSS